jgi:hypothetical protein
MFPIRHRTLYAGDPFSRLGNKKFARTSPGDDG